MAALEPLGVVDGEEGVRILSRRGIVEGPHLDAALGSTYAFRHALLRDAGYASLARAERAWLHVCLAQWLVSLAHGRRGQLAELIGRHYAAALENAPRLVSELAPGVGRSDAALAAASWFELGAEAALELSAHETACTLLRRSLAHTAEATLDEARRRRRLGETIALSADMEEGAAELERARELSRALLSDDERRVDARREYAAATGALGWVFNQQVLFDRARDLAEEGLAEVGAGEDAETARLLMLRAYAVGYGTDGIEEPLVDLRRAVSLARRAGAADVELEAQLLTSRWEVDIGLAPIEDLRRVQELCLARGRWAHAANAMRAEALVLAETRADEAAAALDRAEELCRSRGLSEELAWIDYSRTELGLLYGDWDGAVARGSAPSRWRSGTVIAARRFVAGTRSSPSRWRGATRRC
ncbi:MAG: hypothetical protein ABR583_12515 [Gaiellaceae bacterium]